MKLHLSLESLEAREPPSSLRHQMFAIVDRTQMLGDDVIVDGRIITAENYDSASRDTPKYKLLVAPLILDMDSTGSCDPSIIYVSTAGGGAW